MAVSRSYCNKNRWPLMPKSSRMETTDPKMQRWTFKNEMDEWMDITTRWNIVK